jgi:hypothetical protein
MVCNLSKSNEHAALATRKCPSLLSFLQCCCGKLLSIAERKLAKFVQGASKSLLSEMQNVGTTHAPLI